MEMRMLAVAVVLLIISSSSGLDNGLARTPPMGWLSWERFRCNLDCKNDPDHCVSENLYKRAADEIVAGGYKDVGYEYVSIDDCWLAKTRDAQGRLQPDPERFPNGIKSLADYIHSKGLKMGIYEDFGTKTCVGFPGSEFHLKTDAQTFAEWGIDLVKFDGCNSDIRDMSTGYPLFGHFLNQTGRPMLYSCSWPAYLTGSGVTPNYTLIKQYCNIWRNYDDIQDSWDETVKIIEYYAKNDGGFADVAGPGGFNDPDELLVGDFGLSYDQQKAQFGMWAIMASPLLMSVDLRNISPEAKAILQHRGVIAINQDPLGKQGMRIYKADSLEYWFRPLANKCSAFAFLNLDDQGRPRTVTTTLQDMGLQNPAGYNITDVYENKVIGTFRPADSVQFSVNPTGIFLGKAVPLK